MRRTVRKPRQQVVDYYLGDMARWIELIESLPSRHSKKGAHA